MDPPTTRDQVQSGVVQPLPWPRRLPHDHLFTRPATGCHGVRALQDHGAGEGGGRPPAPSSGLPAEGGRRVSVPAADQQPQGPGAVSGEKGSVDNMANLHCSEIHIAYCHSMMLESSESFLPCTSPFKL